MAKYDYEINGSNVEDLGIRPPRGEFRDAARLVDRLDGHQQGVGFPVAVWRFDVLTESMVETLRNITGGAYSTDVTIQTRIPADGTNPERFVTYNAVMLWPADIMSKRKFNSHYLGVEITFRRLVAV